MQDVRVAAMSCIEGLLTIWPRVALSGRKNGIESSCVLFIHFYNSSICMHLIIQDVTGSALGSQFLGELLGSLIQQKRLIVSDENILPSLFSNLLGNSCHSILISESVGQRYPFHLLAFLFCVYGYDLVCFKPF